MTEPIYVSRIAKSPNEPIKATFVELNITKCQQHNVYTTTYVFLLCDLKWIITVCNLNRGVICINRSRLGFFCLQQFSGSGMRTGISVISLQSSVVKLQPQIRKLRCLRRVASHVLWEKSGRSLSHYIVKEN